MVYIISTGRNMHFMWKCLQIAVFSIYIFQKFPGGGMLPDPPSSSMLYTPPPKRLVP